MSLAQLAKAAKTHHLAIFGALHTEGSDDLGPGTIVLLGPEEPGFWAHLHAQPELSDTAPDPIDRWSTRVVTALAKTVGGQALFPFGDPARPFIGWALRSGRAWVSPVGLLVHDVAGLMVSYRGAILLGEQLDLPGTPVFPCENCADQPCLAACPVSALGSNGYDLATCHGYLETDAGRPCMTRGCAVRTSCPVSLTYGRLPAQSAHHMRYFHGT